MRRLTFVFLLFSTVISRYLKRRKLTTLLNYAPKKDDTSKLITETRNRRKLKAKILPSLIGIAIIGVISFGVYSSQFVSGKNSSGSNCSDSLCWLSKFSDIRLSLFQNSISEGVIGVYRLNSLPPLVLGLTSKSLVNLDKSGVPYPGVAKEWMVNNDATVYTFKLQDDLYWHDNTKVIASDIVFNLPDVEVTYPDNQTIQFKLADSFVPFPTLLTMPVLKKDTLIGLGKYRVEKIETNRNLVSHLSLEPVQNDERLPKLYLKFYPDEKVAKTAFELGEVDSLLGITDDRELKTYPTAEVRQITNFNKIVGVFYNTKDPILSDKNFRKGLSAAIMNIDSEEKTRTSIPAFSWAYNDTLKDISGNEELAKTYLEKVKAGRDSQITLVTIPSLYWLGEKIVADWEKVGISAVLRVESGIPQNFQALLTTQYIPQDPDQYALWHSTQTNTNLSKYKSDRVDKDLEDGRKSADPKVRKERYLDFQKVIADDSPATFLHFPKYTILYRKKAENLLNQVWQYQLNFIK